LRLVMLLSVPVVVVSLAGCDSCGSSSPSPTPGAPSVASAAPSASAPPGPSANVGASGKMAHCPDAVQGAKSVIADVPGGVQLTITATDTAAVADIRARTQALLDAQKNQGTTVHHTGTGEGGGLLGRCPVVLKDTTVAAADVDQGTKVTVTAKDPAELDWLRRETRDRQEDLEAAGSPAGAGKMSHCPSAVDGAMTTLKNMPDGVRVTVTAKDDTAIKAIRDRSKHLAEIADSMADAGPDAAAAIASHTGEGGGGGGIGRCPVVVRDTSIKVKDVTGGSQIDVKAKSAAAVTPLQKEATERAAKFQLPGAPSASGSASAAPAPKPAPSASH
jgi:TusA-related sulfurtransferase